MCLVSLVGSNQTITIANYSITRTNQSELVQWHCICRLNMVSSFNALTVTNIVDSAHKYFYTIYHCARMGSRITSGHVCRIPSSHNYYNVLWEGVFQDEAVPPLLFLDWPMVFSLSLEMYKNVRLSCHFPIMTSSAYLARISPFFNLAALMTAGMSTRPVLMVPVQ